VTGGSGGRLSKPEATPRYTPHKQEGYARPSREPMASPRHTITVSGEAMPIMIDHAPAKAGHLHPCHPSPDQCRTTTDQWRTT
jgi:hypothetical protein